jgi:hypothetical protein
MRTLLLTIMVGALLLPNLALACDSDSECGLGGTCIKREKRARGVCYGGDLSQPKAPAGTPAPGPAFAAPGPGGGFLAPGPGIGLFDPLANPTERPANACVVTHECPAGMDCVITGPGWGSCMAL